MSLICTVLAPGRQNTDSISVVTCRSLGWSKRSPYYRRFVISPRSQTRSINRLPAAQERLDSAQGLLMSVSGPHVTSLRVRTAHPQMCRTGNDNRDRTPHSSRLVAPAEVHGCGLLILVLVDSLRTSVLASAGRTTFTGNKPKTTKLGIPGRDTFLVALIAADLGD